MSSFELKFSGHSRFHRTMTVRVSKGDEQLFQQTVTRSESSITIVYHPVFGDPCSLRMGLSLESVEPDATVTRTALACRQEAPLTVEITYLKIEAKALDPVVVAVAVAVLVVIALGVFFFLHHRHNSSLAVTPPLPGAAT